MKASAFLLIPLFTIAAACGGSGSSGPGEAATGELPAKAAFSMSDGEIAAILYDPGYSLPDGFYVDERADTGRSYTIHHILDDSASFELCTDDYQTALSWEEADNASRAVTGVFVSAAETSRYFEFVRELAYTSGVGNITDPTSPGYARVFKCSSTNRDGVDRSLLDGYAGVINARPVSAAEVREFTEYLWQFRFFATGRRVVLESTADSLSASVDHVLRLAFRTSQGPDRCDRVEVSEWRFSADRGSGEVRKTYTVLRTFEAQLVDGAPLICD